MMSSAYTLWLCACNGRLGITPMIRYAQILSEAGYGVLLFDLRAHGESDGTLFPMTDHSQDVTPAVAYLQDRKEIDPERIGAVGLSLGAEVIVEAAARDAALKALVVDGISTNRMEDLLPLPPEYRIMYLAAPMWWLGDRMAELVSGIPARPLVVLVSRWRRLTNRRITVPFVFAHELACGPAHPMGWTGRRGGAFCASILSRVAIRCARGSGCSV
jgi:pimeloyl-ACP methyl ester carboxylesterase